MKARPTEYGSDGRPLRVTDPKTPREHFYSTVEKKMTPATAAPPAPKPKTKTVREELTELRQQLAELQEVMARHEKYITKMWQKTQHMVNPLNAMP